MIKGKSEEKKKKTFIFTILFQSIRQLDFYGHLFLLTVKGPLLFFFINLNINLDSMTLFCNNKLPHFIMTAFFFPIRSDRPLIFFELIFLLQTVTLF